MKLISLMDISGEAFADFLQTSQDISYSEVMLVCSYKTYLQLH